MIDARTLSEELRQLYLRSHRTLDAMMRAEGVSLARYKLLNFISTEGAVRSADIASSFGYSPRTVTEGLDALEREGLIRRDPDPADRRAKRISITPAGQSALGSTEPARERFLAAVFGGLTGEEREAFSALLRKMNSRLETLGP